MCVGGGVTFVRVCIYLFFSEFVCLFIGLCVFVCLFICGYYSVRVFVSLRLRFPVSVD